MEISNERERLCLMFMQAAKASPLYSPVPVFSYPALSLLLLALGLFSTAYFFM